MSIVEDQFDELSVSSVTVDGATVRYRRYRQPDRDVLVLVHGAAANAVWWRAMVSLLAPHFQLLLPDLSGHGLSDHRDNYDAETWARELAAILEAEDVTEATVVGHSMGGYVTAFLCVREPERVGRAVLIDSGFRSPGVDGHRPRGRERRPDNRIYETPAAALARFRLLPAQPVVRPELLALVAQASLRQVPGGWTWRFDPQIFQRFTDGEIDEQLRQVRQPLALIYGENSDRCGPDTAEYVRAASGSDLPTVSIPGAYHHVPIDQPEATAQALLQLLLLQAP
ncbi:MAG: alpha/beta hydrolase [Dehalococcoidia bacterium]